jgi:tripartite-type tricarboxylate transporter receptor subunit TctC
MITAVLLSFSASHVAAQSGSAGYPVKPVRIVTGFPPGGSTDVIARLTGAKLAEVFGQQFIVENRPGASTAIAAERVATSPPDGYTLLLIASSTTAQSALRKKNLPYDLEAFGHISMLATGSFALVVHPSVPAKDLKALIAIAREKPGRLNYGSAGVGSVNHLAALLFIHRAGIDMVHVAYKGAAEATIENASGQIDLSFPSIPAALPLIEQRRIRALAVTGAKRTGVLRDVPTVAEAALPGYQYSGALGLAAPPATPREIVRRLNAAIVKVIGSAELQEAIAKTGFEAQSMTPEQYSQFVRDDISSIAAAVLAAGVKIE